MCRVTGTAVVRPSQYYPSNNGNAELHQSLPSKSSLRRSPSPNSVVLPSSHKKKSVSFAVADVTSQVSRKASEKDDMEYPSPKPDVLTSIHEAVLPPASSMSPSEKAEIWWQSHDYSIFSGTARLISGEIRRRAAAMASAAAARSAGAHHRGVIGSNSTNTHTESYANVLTQVLHACSLAATSTSNATSTPGDKENDVKSHPLEPSLFAYLAHWTRSGHSRRGLERWSVAYHGSKRNEDRERQIQAVLMAQAEVSSDDDKDNKIKAASESHSRAARLFALTIGHADAAAVGTSYPS